MALFYDLDYYDYKNKKEDTEQRDKFVISQQRLLKLIHMYISSQNNEKNDENIADKIIPHL